MKYTMHSPCTECPFLKKKKGFKMSRLKDFASGTFPCHKTADSVEGVGFVANKNSVHCAGALIFLEKRNAPNQMMRIAERLGMYDRTKLDMCAEVR